ncbi:MAG: hypothetical protein HY696_10965 [Deltaproteobacteria bacterium]|nr:hypothetical protein [Deltaproteobacteria bacterium]
MRRFFHCESHVVPWLELLGVLAVGGYLARLSNWSTLGLGSQIAIGVFVAEYTLLRAFGSFRYYPRPANAPRLRKYPGIEWQFRTALVMAAYVLLFNAACLHLGLTPHVLWLSNLGFAFLLYVNCHLLYFHRRDTDPTPVNYFSARLGESAATTTVQAA